MILVMGVSLLTVRIILNALGATDYGIYNVVGGIVTMFSFLSGTMVSASQRFFAFELGRKDYVRLKQTFCLTLLIYIGIAIIILLLAETIGLWFLNTQMNVPIERMNAANWVYQFSVFSFLMTILTIPYNSAIIAREKMNIYAYVSLLDVILKLFIAFFLVLFSNDKLKLYAILTFGVTTIVTFIYRTYCRQKYEECSFSFYWDKFLFKEIVSFSGWNMIGSTAGVLKEQGINILLNIFFNPTVNAARTIAHQVNAVLLSFTNNLYMAVRPQIVKSYATDDKKNMERLVFKSSKIGFYLIMFLTMPIILETHYILLIWLKEVPNYAVIFTKLVLINILLDAMNIPFVNAIQATGQIKLYQTTYTLLFFFNLPVTYLFLKLGYPPQTAAYVSIGISLLCYIPRLLIFQKTTGISFSHFLRKTLSIVAIVYCITILPTLFVVYYLDESFLRFITICFITILWGTIVVYIIGLDKTEKDFIKNKILYIFNFL